LGESFHDKHSEKRREVYEERLFYLKVFYGKSVPPVYRRFAFCSTLCIKISGGFMPNG